MEAYPIITHGLEPTELISIHIECEKLANMDYFSESDPVCEVYSKDKKEGSEWVKIGETEQINNNLNPKFVKSFQLEYFFERETMLKFCLYDVDVMTRDHIGDMETTIGRIMGSRKQTYKGNLFSKNGNTTGKIIISAEKVATENYSLNYIASISGLPPKVYWVFFGRDDPFYFIERSKGPESDEFIRVYQSPHQVNTTSPRWRDEKITSLKLCNSDVN